MKNRIFGLSCYSPKYWECFIQAGVYKPGEKLPGENELAKRFNVSRNTLRQAILLLHEDGYVSNHQGKGTFVIHNHAEHTVSVEKVENPLTAFALDPVDEVLTDFEIRKISPKNQEVFRLDSSRLLILIKTVYKSCGNPIGCSITLIPYDTFSAASIPLDRAEAVAAFYRELLGREGCTGVSTLRVTAPRDPVDRMLEISGQQPLLMLDEVIYDSHENVVMTQKLFMRPSSYEIDIIRRSGKNDRNLLLQTPPLMV